MPSAPPPRKTLILSRSQVEGLVGMAEVIDAVEAAHADMSRGAAAQPPPGAMTLPSGPGSFLTMAALAHRQGLAAVKLLADIPDNPARGLPSQRSVLVLVSKATGFCEAILHGQIPTRIRTAAASAVATRHLARADSRILGLIGAGDLAVEHVRALTEVRPFARVAFWTRNPETAARFSARVAADHPGLAVEAQASPRAVFEAADVVCTLTPSREPVVEGAWFRPGQRVNAVGAPPRPDHREIDAAGMARARVFLDSRATALHESGDLLLAIAEGALAAADVGPEIGDVIVGAAPGRRSADEITLFNSVGIAMQDVAIGGFSSRGRGRRASAWRSISQDRRARPRASLDARAGRFDTAPIRGIVCRTSTGTPVITSPRMTDRPFGGLDLEPLYRECFLRSQVRRETYDCIASELCDYGLSWSGKRVDAHAHRARAGRVAAYAMGYGDEVTIRPRLYGDFMLVHVSLRNGIEVEADGRIVHVPEGRAYLSAPRRSVRLRWQEGCEQLLIRVPLDLLSAAPGTAASVRSGVVVPQALQPLLVDQINMLLKIARMGDDFPQLGAWADWLEAGFGRLLGHQLIEGRPRPAGEARRDSEPGADRRERIERFIAGHLDAPVSLDDLAAAAGLGRTQLNQLCRETWGCSPMAHLRRRRLEAARDDLARRPEQDLTQLSLRYGFEHQSRFAQYWRAAFGELPSETRRRCR